MKVTEKKTGKPEKFPWQSPNGKLVDDFRLVTSINELIWRSFDEKGKCSKRPIFHRMTQAFHALETAGIPTRYWTDCEYRRLVRTLCTDVEKAKRRIFRRTCRKGEVPKKMYEYDNYLREMGLKAELLFVGMLDQSKDMAYPERGCYAILRIPGTNRCIVALLYHFIKVEHESDGGDT